MSRIIGDRREKSALDEMMEVSRARNADIAEEERLEAARRAKASLQETSAEAPSANSIITADYKNLEFQIKVTRDFGKVILSYDKSLARIKKAGYERHPSPAEAFSLIADSLEEKLQGDLKKVAKDMLVENGEWLSMAVERKKDILTCYLHPEGLVWDNEKKIHEKIDFKYNGKQEFNISRKWAGKWISLGLFEDNFVKLFYGRSFGDLPREMRQGNERAKVYIPLQGEVYPIGSNGFPLRFNIGNSYFARASRGVRAGDSQ